MGLRGLGPINKNVLSVSPDRFPNDMLGFWTSKTIFASPDRFPNDILGFLISKVVFDYYLLDAQ